VSSGRRSAPLDERAWHRWLAARVPRGHNRLPIGDDAAALSIRPNEVLVVTTDAFTERFHFLADAPARSIGRGLVGANLSDLAAKGARPVGFLLDLLLPPGTPERWARELVDGVHDGLRGTGAELLGGDTKPAASRAVVGTALGVADPRHLAPRTGARPGDALVVTGHVGRGGRAYARWRSTGRAAAARELLDIRPRSREGVELARSAHAMLDTSDGIAESAHLLAQASGVTVVLVADQIPRVPERPGGAAVDWPIAFFGGDYELLAAVPPPGVARARQRLRALGTPMTVVGRVEAGRGAWLERDGRRRALPAAGWRPFDGDAPE
jgi:thiamine-monophosphate kinase